MTLDLNTSKTNAAPVAINTKKSLDFGLKINLSKANNTLVRAAMRISWVGEDLDICAVGLNEHGESLQESKTVRYDRGNHAVPCSLIFYMNLFDQGISHGGDLKSSGNLEVEQINCMMEDFRSDVHQWDFIVSSHVVDDKALLLGDVSQMNAEVVDLETGDVLYSTSLDCKSVANQSAAVFASLYREGKDWSYETKLQGIGTEPQGVQNILNHYYAS